MRVLFQGDSVTDSGRDRGDMHSLSGYTAYAAEMLGEGYECFNRGVSGDRSSDVLARYAEDIEAMEPDIFCLMIGINNVWRRFDANLYTSAEDYGNDVREILRRLKAHNRDVKIVLVEPFVLPEPTRLHWRTTLIGVIDELRQIATEYADALVPLDGLLARECVHTPWAEISEDGVHPTDKGHKLIASLIADEIKKL